MQSKSAWFIARWVLVAPFLACSSKPVQPVLTHEEQLRQDQKMGAEWATGLEEVLKFRQDIEITVYLRKLAVHLASQDSALKDAPVGVFLIEEIRGRWTNFSLPGNRLYLSAGWLKTVEFESELAAGIAVQLGHLRGRHWMNRGSSWVEGTRPVFFGAGGLFEFTDGERLEAAEAAVELLYKSGFDPRGTISLWANLRKYPDTSPVSGALCDQLRERSRHVVTQFTPLRNPIVRSAEFITLRKRFQKL